ncbi:MAG: TIGR02466 family protein [Bdellovibrionales bacterium]
MITKLFPTHVYYENLTSASGSLQKQLLKECYQLRDYDKKGRKWSESNYAGGYTSYSSMSELFRFSSTFENLKNKIDRHVKKFANTLDMDVKNHKLEMTNLWVNIVPKGTFHSLHLHPVSSISGTFYVQVEKKSSKIKFEDPRMTCFMGSVPRKPSAKLENQRFYKLLPQNGHVLLFESWLRHEVEQNMSEQDRVSISFNYNWF